MSSTSLAADAVPLAPRSDAGFGTFFRYHGWLSPGIRLFRRIGFPAKAGCVALAFLVPLTMLMAFVAMAAKDSIEIAQAERRGVTYVEAATALVQAAQDRRRALANGRVAADAAAAHGPVRQAFAKLLELQQAHGAEFGTGDRFENLRRQHEALLAAATGGDAEAAFNAHGEYIAAALALVVRAADGSQLALDPELASYHLMNMGVLRLPAQAENAARLRGLGLLTIRSQQLPNARRDAIARGTAIGDLLDAESEGSFLTLKSAEPESAAKLPMQQADEAGTAFKQVIEQQLMAPTLGTDEAAFQARADAAVQRLWELQRAAVAELDRHLADRVQRERSALAWKFAVSLGFIALAGYLLLSFYRVMLGGLTEVAGHLEAVAAGNLGTAPRPWGRDEAAQLMLTLGEMQDSLRRIIGSVLQSAQQVQTASEEIAAASQDLSSRTEQTAANLQQTASSMEQISGAVKHTAETVVGASAIVQANAEAATRGGQVIGEVVRTMQDIQASSNRIGEIIGVIDSIAFQTNILALNAAVEAARAGEQGRGFAVVATEVRALAGRSAAAAREIKALIGASLEQVEAGSRVAGAAGRTMQEIVDNAGRIASLMDEIATATREQSGGVGLVGGAVAELDRSTQQNAALVEQTSAASGALSAQAQRLAADAGFFKLA